MIAPARPRIPTPTLCLLTDLGVVGNDVSRLIEVIDIAVQNGVNMVQIRAPELADADFAVLVGCVVTAVDERALTVVNPSQREVRRYLGVDGVHLPEGAHASASEVRRANTDSILVGGSVHSEDGARAATNSGADYLIMGTIFPSESHPGGEAHGAGIIERVQRVTSLPVVGIGGITEQNVRDVMASGACGVAVIRSILGAEDPASATRGLFDAMVEASNA